MCGLLYVSHVCVGGGGGGGVEGKIRSVGGASWLRVGRQVRKVCAMYTKQLMGVKRAFEYGE